VIVTDTDLLAYLLVPSGYSEQADALFDRDPEWAVPILWRSEFRNFLAGCLRRQALAFDDVLKTQAEAEALVAGNEHEVDSRRVLELVRDSDCSAYDCGFVALASRLGVKVVTMDAKVLKAFQRHATALAPRPRRLSPSAAYRGCRDSRMTSQTCRLYSE
jgi:predicted nucleic acid-binding protein